MKIREIKVGEEVVLNTKDYYGGLSSQFLHEHGYEAGMWVEVVAFAGFSFGRKNWTVRLPSGLVYDVHLGDILNQRGNETTIEK